MYDFDLTKATHRRIYHIPTGSYTYYYEKTFPSGRTQWMYFGHEFPGWRPSQSCRDPEFVAGLEPIPPGELPQYLKHCDRVTCVECECLVPVVTVTQQGVCHTCMHCGQSFTTRETNENVKEEETV